ncbi:hypothetical protein N7512_006526 [Penicillium capsulatum]|nr:hypothetical protein N7512_006526 [Penicillium capsulatum]
MESPDFEPDPFSSDSLWRLSRFSIEALQPLEALPWSTDLPDIAKSTFQGSLDSFENIDSVWKLPSFSNDLESSTSTHDSSINSSIDSQSDTVFDPPQTQADVDDIWALETLKKEYDQPSPLKSWENFRDPSSREPVSAYFSESGAKGLDAALAHRESLHGAGIAGRLVKPNIFIRSLVCLGLGWNSPFFRYNPQTLKFERCIDHVRVSGVSLSAVDGVVQDVLQCGTHMQRARAFARHPTANSKPLSSLFTLRGTVNIIMYNLERQILCHSNGIASILQVNTLFQRCGELMSALVDIVDAAEKATSDAHVISAEIVIRVTGPWLAFVESWIGLRADETIANQLAASGSTFIQLEQQDDPTRFKAGSSRVEYNYCADNMPTFIPVDQAQTIFETGKSLRLLKSGHPNHPIARPDALTRAGHLHLQCVSQWMDIEEIQQKAWDYGSKIRAEVLEYQRSKSSSLQSGDSGLPLQDVCPPTKEITKTTFELFDIDDDAHLTGSFMDEQPLSSDGVNQLLQRARSWDLGSVDANRFGPEITSGLYLSLAPVIWSQAQLIDFALLHDLFKENNVRQHLNLQWRFQLLGDGSFASRLSYSLFDPEMESGERKTGVVRSGVHTGLRLGSRDSWPPASSELRLVLIGLLGDCYFGDADPESSEQTPNQRDNELPGDPNAIEALDFLRLQYKPPEALEALITVRSLKKYDRLFKHLLRLIRMVSAVKGLVRDSTSRESQSGDTRNIFQKFRIDAQHFVLAISEYCFQIGIGSSWNRFQDTLGKIERCLDRGDMDGTIEVAHSVPRLRDYHEDVLDQMLFAFFLSKRHAPAAKLLDSIFSTILAFVPLSKLDGTSGIRHENEGTVSHLYATFRKQVSALVGYLRGLDSGNGSSKSMGKSSALFGSQTEPTSVFEHLRMRLEVKDYY